MVNRNPKLGEGR